MKVPFSLFRATIALLAVFFMTASAFAQSTILVVDRAKILRDSEVGKHIGRQLDSIAKSMETELNAAVSPLEAEGKTLQAEIKALGSMDLSARPDLKSRLTSFAGKSKKQQYEMVMKQRELKKTENVAIAKVLTKMQEILKVVIAERNADVVLDANAVLYGKPVDVTDLVLSRMNSQMRTVAVLRERLPRQAQ